MISIKKKTTPAPAQQDNTTARFQDGFFSALSDVVFQDELENSITSIVAGARRAFGGDAFLFTRSGDFAGLGQYSTERPDEIVGLLRKGGIRLSANKIPLSGARAKLFELVYAEYDDLFSLAGDFTTAAACRKIQRDLQFKWIASVSVKTETAELALLVLVPAKSLSLRQDLGRFALLLKAAHYLSALKARFHDLDTKFDEQLIRLKNEFREKEGVHLFLFNEMPVAGAILDEHGVITEANDGLKLLAGTGVDPVGKSFSSLLSEDERTGFVQFMMNVVPGKDDRTPVRIAGRDFKAYLITRRKEDGQPGISAVYLADTTAEMELQGKLGRTVDELRADNEASEKLAEEAKRYSEEIVKASGLPIVLVSAGIVKLASEQASQFLTVQLGQGFRDFLVQNGLLPLAEDETVSEIVDSRRRTLSVTRWKIGDDLFLAFNDITGAKKMEEELRSTMLDAEKLFSAPRPTAAVKGETISKWNNMFAGLFKEFLSSDKSFDGFLRYAGESPEAFKSELHAGGVVMRTCRTTDGKYINLTAAKAGDTVFLFLEDFTEQDLMKQQLRQTQGLLNSSLESFTKEPIFVVENGVVRASNLAARNMLPVMLDESVEPAKILAGMGIKNRDDMGELNGDFYRVETAAVGSSIVYRFTLVNAEMEQRAEIERLKRRQEILKELSSADRFEDLLHGLNDLLKNDDYTETKAIGAGTVSTAKEMGDVFLMTAASGEIEPMPSLNVTESDIAAIRQGGVLSRKDMPGTTFMEVISAGDSVLLVQGTVVGDTYGFASIAFHGTEVSMQYLDQLAGILKVCSSVAAGLSARKSVERKFEDSGKVTKAIVGLTGMGGGTFEETSHKSIDLLRQVFGAESVGVYSLEGASMNLLSSNGTLPAVLSVPGARFGTISPVSQLGSDEMKTAEGRYIAVKSRPQKLAVVLIFTGAIPAPAEVNAVSSLALDILESRRTVEEQAKVSAQLLDNSKLLSEFMMRLAKAATPEEVVKTLSESLSAKDKDSSVEIKAEVESPGLGRPMEFAEKESAGLAAFEVNFTNVGLGVLTVQCSRDPLLRTMIELAVDKIRGIFALKLPAVQSETTELRVRLERAKVESAALRESVDRISGSLRNARTEIDDVLSRLSYLQGDEKVMQEIELHLTSAAKKMSIDLDHLQRNQDDLFVSTREAVMESGGLGRKIRKFDTATLTEFRFDQTTFDLLKDLFLNFVTISATADCEVLLMTSQATPAEDAEGRGKHVSARITGGEDEILHDNDVRASDSVQALIGRIEGLGYNVATKALGNELTIDICEAKPAAAGDGEVLSALLVEGDKQLLEKESQSLMLVFSCLKVTADAAQAADLLAAEKFNAAFVGLSLPSINGREICRQIKRAQPGCLTVLLVNREGEEKSEGVDYIALRPLEEEKVRSYIEK